MRYIFNFPDIGEGLDEGTIAEWYVVKGQPIKSGDPLLKMETDKVVTDIPSPRTGTIVAVYGKVGEVVKVGEPLVEIEIEGVAGTEETHTETVKEEGAGVVGTLEIAGNNAYLPASAEGVDGNLQMHEKPLKKALATPVARAMAKELNIEINLITGTGPGGRITTTDIQKYFDSSQNVLDKQKTISIPLEERVTIEPLSQIRKTIAKNMTASIQNAVHMTVHEEVEITKLAEVRNKYKLLYAEKEIKLSYLPFILKATAMALKKHRSLNAQLDLENSRMIYKNYYNIGIAVDTEDGLVVPVIRDVDKLSIQELAKKVNEISAKARDRKLNLEDMKDGTFTITNYGSIGGIFAAPVINYPQAGILGIGRTLEKPVIINGNIEKGLVMPLSLSVDHRIVDGGEVTRFLNEIIKYLGDPIALLMD
jgi:pyruvate dehydrogenase E2 component (dihydrolipoamide acetyltransferase)